MKTISASFPWPYRANNTSGIYDYCIMITVIIALTFPRSSFFSLQNICSNPRFREKQTRWPDGSKRSTAKSETLRITQAVMRLACIFMDT